jgi:hypothetical protein
MNIVLLAQQCLLRLATRLFNHLARVAEPKAHDSKNSTATSEYAIKSVASYAISTGAESNFSSKNTTKPLRIVRVVETGQARTSVGRMVISGRMADVCAELDRLAACEAALT